MFKALLLVATAFVATFAQDQPGTYHTTAVHNMLYICVRYYPMLICEWVTNIFYIYICFCVVSYDVQLLIHYKVNGMAV